MSALKSCWSEKRLSSSVWSVCRVLDIRSVMRPIVAMIPQRASYLQGTSVSRVLDLVSTMEVFLSYLYTAFIDIHIDLLSSLY